MTFLSKERIKEICLKEAETHDGDGMSFGLEVIDQTLSEQQEEIAKWLESFESGDWNHAAKLIRSKG